MVSAAPATAHVTMRAPQPASVTKSVMPNKISEVDCNGWSPKYKSVNPAMKPDCVDPLGPMRTKTYKNAAGRTVTMTHPGRFSDNGHYVGHDEPDVKFISHAAHSGNTFTFFLTLPHDPVKHATNDGKVIDYAELSPAPWFGLPMCDPKSYPQNPCTPDSDTNSGNIADPKAAGSAFMELQFYPPKFTPKLDNVSCSSRKWCAALNIDSLESQFNFVNLNLNCEEPVNFAFLQRNGVPDGPPGPELSNAQTNTPNKETLLMNSGDVLELQISDPVAGFTTKITDLTTHQSGFMVASAKNGFMNTNFKTCGGTPHTFHAEYATASQPNQVPWAALEGGVLMQQEIGHGEVCSSLKNQITLGGSSDFTDKSTFQNCVGGSNEGAKDQGEGPCNPNTGICQNATTEGTTGPIACPTNNAASNQLCEFSDGVCLPQGNRTVTLSGHLVTENSPVNFCGDDLFQNGDLDYDGISYRSTSWPDGSPNVPTSFRYVGPFDASGHAYPNIQFQTNAPGSEFLCNTFDGLNCDVPPLAAQFYPFWTMTNLANQQVGSGLFPKNACVWNFGNVIPGVTTRNFGKDTEYGTPDVARFGGSSLSAVLTNPETQTGHGCTALSMPKKV